MQDLMARVWLPKPRIQRRELPIAIALANRFKFVAPNSTAI